MFKSKQYRAKAAEYGALLKSSTSPNERREFQQLEQRFASLAENEQGLADDHDGSVHIADQDRSHDAALADEEERVLRCLGAAVIMQWDTLPTSLRREIFDTAGSVGRLMETAALRGQIARFLHKHKNDGRNSKPASADTRSDSRPDEELRSAAMSRWDNEGDSSDETLM
jgi:hypothetical protein